MWLKKQIKKKENDIIKILKACVFEGTTTSYKIWSWALYVLFCLGSDLRMGFVCFYTSFVLELCPQWFWKKKKKNLRKLHLLTIIYLFIIIILYRDADVGFRYIVWYFNRLKWLIHSEEVGLSSHHLLSPHKVAF